MADGARLITGGRREGALFSPTVLDRVSPGSELVTRARTLVKSPGGTVPTTTTTSTTTSTTIASSTTTTTPISTTTTSTTIVAATTSTTLPAASVAACGVIDCDDGNPCTIDICTPGLGCRHDPVDFAALRHGIESDVVVRACIGQRVPPVVTGLIRRARAQVDQAAHATNPRRARRLVGRALQHLRQSRRLVAAAGTRGHLSAPCAADLGTRIQTAEDRGACLRPLPSP